MKKPNFFVLGAPKCGTTSLCDWLSEHEDIFFSPVKEPNYFNSDSAHGDILSLSQYEACFAGATQRHRAVGEGSVWYLRSGVAVANILEYAPDARFIVCIRNPVDAAISMHNQAFYNGEEPIGDFEQAWHAQWDRQKGTRTTPASCADVSHLLYAETFSFGKQLQRLYSLAGRSRVLVITLDEMSHDAADAYRRTLAHLDVTDDHRQDFALSNPAKSRKWQQPAVVLQYLAVTKARLGIRSGTGLGGWLNRINTRVRPAKPVDPGVRAIVQRYFQPDLVLCAEVLDKDLSAWMQ